MSDTVPMPASGNPRDRGAPDGVSATPAAGSSRGVHGRTKGGESEGANYPDPQAGKAGASGDDGSAGHGGQTQMDYYGSGQRGAGGTAAGNAVAGSNSAADNGPEAPAEAVERPPHEVTAAGRTFSVVEDSGVAAAEVSADLGPEAANDTKDSARAG